MRKTAQITEIAKKLTFSSSEKSEAVIYYLSLPVTSKRYSFIFITRRGQWASSWGPWGHSSEQQKCHVRQCAEANWAWAPSCKGEAGESLENPQSLFRKAILEYFELDSSGWWPSKKLCSGNVHLESSSFQDATDKNWRERIKYYRKTADALAHINLAEHPVSPSNVSRISAFHIWTSQGLD